VVWQPSERLWPLSNEGVTNRDFEEIEELEESLVERYVVLCNQPEVIHWYTYQHWWPQATSESKLIYTNLISNPDLVALVPTTAYSPWLVSWDR
jgi:hypothetical protein